MWLTDVANQRVHGTTHQFVTDAWQQERQHLQPVAAHPPYPYVPEVRRRVSHDAYVAYGANRYSVPWAAAGRDVWVREFSGRIAVYDGLERIAVHALCPGWHRVLTQPQHHQGIPLGANQRTTSGKILIQVSSPHVEVRPQAVYEAIGAEGSGA